MSIATGQTIEAADFDLVAVRAIQNAGQTLTTVAIVLAFAAESFDTHNFHDNVTDNSRLTVPAGKGGTYFIGATLQNTNNNETNIRLRLNGSTIIAGAVGGGVSGVGNGSVSTIYELVAGDYIEVLAQGSPTTSSSGDAATNFWMQRIVESA